MSFSVQYGDMPGCSPGTLSAYKITLRTNVFDAGYHAGAQAYLAASKGPREARDQIAV